MEANSQFEESATNKLVTTSRLLNTKEIVMEVKFQIGQMQVIDGNPITIESTEEQECIAKVNSQKDYERLSALISNDSISNALRVFNSNQILKNKLNRSINTGQVLAAFSAEETLADIAQLQEPILLFERDKDGRVLPVLIDGAQNVTQTGNDYNLTIQKASIHARLLMHKQDFPRSIGCTRELWVALHQMRKGDLDTKSVTYLDGHVILDDVDSILYALTDNNQPHFGVRSLRQNPNHLGRFRRVVRGDVIFDA